MPQEPESQSEFTMGYVPVRQVLEGARHLSHVLVIGEEEDGTPYCAASTSDNQWLIFMLEWFKQHIFQTIFNHEED